MPHGRHGRRAWGGNKIFTGTLMSKQQIRSEILRLTREYSRIVHFANRPGSDSLRPPYVAGEVIPYAGRVFTEDEVEAAVASALDFWLTLGVEGAAFERELAEMLGVRHTLLVNSGSSANLVAISALTSHKLPLHKRVCPGDEVITVAAGFPTTVAPIVQVGAVPVFIDANPITGNACCEFLEAAYRPGKTKAVMMAHALGNPFDLTAVLEFCQKHDLWLVEDNCDALGCSYRLPLAVASKIGLGHLIKIAEGGQHPLIRIEKTQPGDGSASGPRGEFAGEQDGVEAWLVAPTGSFGDLSTQSFYPPHHITMGEGGAVNIIRKAALKSYAESFRDWGRDCWCASGHDDSCGRRFQWQLGELPTGYDHKYIYSHLGYNLKPLDLQAAIGRVQLRRLPDFVEARKRNWELLRRGLDELSGVLDFALPTHALAWTAPDPKVGFDQTGLGSGFVWDRSGCRSDCSWFGFKITVKETAPFTRTELASHLDRHGVGNRMLFGGNMVRQPAFVHLLKDRPDAFRVVDCRAGQASEAFLPGADRIMNRTLFLGTYPGLTADRIDYMIDTIRRFAVGGR